MFFQSLLKKLKARPPLLWSEVRVTSSKQGTCVLAYHGPTVPYYPPLPDFLELCAQFL